MAVSLQAQVLALRTAVEAALTGTSAEARAPELPWTPGQRLTAQVEAELPGDRYQIRVGNFQFDVDLPVKAQVGDALRLEFVSASPRAAFVLTPDPAQEPAAVETGAVRTPQVQISAAGRVLTQALQTGAAAARPAATPAAPINDAVPLLPAPPSEAAALAAALKGALDRSGLFYEAHLVQWFAGDRPLAALLREPQGQLSTAAQPPQPSPEDPDRASARTSAAAVPSPSVPRPPAEEPRGTAQPLDPQVLGQVRSQLEVIEQRQILWLGQAWPGQPLEWRIEEPPERAASSDEPIPWTTHVRLTLPRLGEVNAELGLSAGSVRVRLAAQTGATASALREARDKLNEALSQAGLVLAGFAVTADDTA